MDRFAQLFEQLSLNEIDRLLRRTVFGSIGVGVVALVVTAVISHILVGLGICIGLGIGLVNIRLVARSVAKVNADQVEKPTRVLASRTLVRLSATTVVVLGLMFASVSLGLGSAGGVALFYFVLLANLVRSLLRSSTAGVSQ
ncbi:MAG TPA: ATP synthase subunit I [Acidimicrobiales bacterium]|nr:ATP synthase subunit I [Acidimicrobiales bacterium]